MGLTAASMPAHDWVCLACYARPAAPAAARPAAAAQQAQQAQPGPDPRTQRWLAERERLQPARQQAVPVTEWEPQYLTGAAARLPAWLHGRLADSSHQSLQSQRQQFRLFGQLANMPPAVTAATLTEQLACWVMGRAENGYKFSTIELGVYAVLDEAARTSGWRGLATEVRLRDALATARR